MTLDALARELTACGIAAKVWQDGKIFVEGYGRQLKVSITPAPGGSLPLDGATIHVTSSWKSTKAALYCKGVKHAVLADLHRAGFISVAPPDDWRKVVLDERPVVRAISRRDQDPGTDDCGHVRQFWDSGIP